MSDRSFHSPLGRQKRFFHQRAHLWGGFWLIFFWFWELGIHLPRLFALRAKLKKQNRNVGHVVIFSDNLDETNGIAINARQVVEYLRDQGKDLVLMGIAFHTRSGGFVEKCGTHLLPQIYSMEQVGYDESELAIPCVDSFCDWIEVNPTDLIEIETPSSGGMMIMAVAKILGIRVISHYRTDIFAYSDLLVTSKLLVKFIKSWVSVFNKMTAPIIVPSTYFVDKLHQESGLTKEQIRYLERGIPLNNFNPNKNMDLWKEYFPHSHGTKFLFVGRISKEKELVFLLDLWRQFVADHQGELLIVGQGPFLAEMKGLAKDIPQIAFSGKLMGNELASIYAEADYFIFPSGTDTFGNVVVESLASGTPAIVSDWGGPRDIVDTHSGWVLPFRDENKWLTQMITCHEIRQNMDSYVQYSRAAEERSKHFKLENAAQILWNFYQEVLGRA